MLIITDGVVHDMSETLDALQDLEEEGISIVIVGVGDQNFSDMKVLDDVGSDEIYKRVKDDSLDTEIHEFLQRRGERSRDLVQFVEFNEKAKNGTMQDLTEEVLREIPNQVVAYFQRHGLSDKKSFKRLTTVLTDDIMPETERKKLFLLNNMDYFNQR